MTSVTIDEFRNLVVESLTEEMPDLSPESVEWAVTQIDTWVDGLYYNFEPGDDLAVSLLMERLNILLVDEQTGIEVLNLEDDPSKRQSIAETVYGAIRSGVYSDLDYGDIVEL